MIKNIWTEIWNRIKDEPEKLEMSDFFTGEKGGYLKAWEVEHNNECFTSCCVIGWASIIAREKGFSTCISDDGENELCKLAFGYPMYDSLDPESVKLHRLCHGMNNEDARAEIERRAKEESANAFDWDS